MPVGPLPLVIGITGHRDLRPGDVPVLEAAVLGVLHELRAQYPSTPLLVLSSLAEGADRLGARVALLAGARLVVPLPMDVADYERDFNSETSRAEFRKILAQAHRTIEVPHVFANAYNAKAVTGRDDLYEQAGAYLAASSQILIALWDGNENGRRGGTSENVRFKLHGVDPRYMPFASPLDPPDTGPVISIVTPRQSGPPPADAFAVKTIYPQSPGETNAGEVRYEQRVFSRIETFNRDAVRLGAKIAHAQARSAAQLSSLKDTDLDTGAGWLRRMYAVSDSLALHFQRLTREMLLTLFVWVFFAAALFEAAKGIGEGLHPLIAVYAAVVLGAAGWWYVANRGDYRNKFLDYRALAEGLRVQFFWRLAGVREDVANHYLRKQRGELDWIRVAAANSNLVADIVPDGGAPEVSHSKSSAESLHAVMSDWVRTQHQYYTRAAWRDQRLSDRIDLIAQWFLWTGVGLSIARALTLVLHFGWFESQGDWFAAVPARAALFDLLFTVLFIVAALLHNYAEKRALSQQSKQYERMSVMFGACERRLTPLMDGHHQAEARALLRELGREALAENADWVLLHRERPLQLSVKA
ncbi:MAG: hypothetical protein JO219_09515 [Candidatus Eremiobacteraeota bacterium]|nr:hypothetical protein [Candidatus Eremiobacteraeota bacterium]